MNRIEHMRGEGRTMDTPEHAIVEEKRQLFPTLEERYPSLKNNAEYQKLQTLANSSIGQLELGLKLFNQELVQKNMEKIKEHYDTAVNLALQNVSKNLNATNIESSINKIAEKNENSILTPIYNRLEQIAKMLDMEATIIDKQGKGFINIVKNKKGEARAQVSFGEVKKAEADIRTMRQNLVLLKNIPELNTVLNTLEASLQKVRQADPVGNTQEELYDAIQAGKGNTARGTKLLKLVGVGVAGLFSTVGIVGTINKMRTTKKLVLPDWATMGWMVGGAALLRPDKFKFGVSGTLQNISDLQSNVPALMNISAMKEKKVFQELQEASKNSDFQKLIKKKDLTLAELAEFLPKDSKALPVLRAMKQEERFSALQALGKPLSDDEQELVGTFIERRDEIALAGKEALGMM